mmetsp:Transcript_8314/g.24924  ORF Transcript_8314/g.24924 Transcript_8314/m.24924 type:complete len:292 (+) Transcript_8314:435-1310(+)
MVSNVEALVPVCRVLKVNKRHPLVSLARHDVAGKQVAVHEHGGGPQLRARPAHHVDLPAQQLVVNFRDRGPLRGILETKRPCRLVPLPEGVPHGGLRPRLHPDAVEPGSESSDPRGVERLHAQCVVHRRVSIEVLLDSAIGESCENLGAEAVGVQLPQHRKLLFSVDKEVGVVAVHPQENDRPRTALRDSGDLIQKVVVGHHEECVRDAARDDLDGGLGAGLPTPHQGFADGRRLRVPLRDPLGLGLSASPLRRDPRDLRTHGGQRALRSNALRLSPRPSPRPAIDLIRLH